MRRFLTFLLSLVLFSLLLGGILVQKAYAEGTCTTDESCLSYKDICNDNKGKMERWFGKKCNIYTKLCYEVDNPSFAVKELDTSCRNKNALTLFLDAVQKANSSATQSIAAFGSNLMVEGLALLNNAQIYLSAARTHFVSAGADQDLGEMLIEASNKVAEAKKARDAANQSTQTGGIPPPVQQPLTPPQVPAGNQLSIISAYIASANTNAEQALTAFSSGQLERAQELMVIARNSLNRATNLMLGASTEEAREATDAYSKAVVIVQDAEKQIPKPSSYPPQDATIATGGAPVPGTGRQPTTDAGGSRGQVPLSSAPAVVVETETEANIHGWTSGEIWLPKGTKEISVGSRVTVKGSSDWVIDEIELIFKKIKDQDGKDVDEQMEIGLSRVGQEDVVDKNYNTFQSYWANLNGSGTYELTAKYKQGSHGEGEGRIYRSSSDRTFVVINIDGTAKITKKPTNARVTFQGRQGSIIKKGANLAQKVNIKELLKSVAGVSVIEEDGKLVVTQDPNNPQTEIVITPAVEVEDEECSSGDIPAVNFNITKTDKTGNTTDYMTDASYPNCQPFSIDINNLTLDDLSHLTATVSYNDPDSEFYPSTGELRIQIADNPAQENVFVQLTSDPAPENITTEDNLITVMAFTNYAVSNPEFEVTNNGQVDSRSATYFNNNCQDGSGSCEYFLEIPQPNRDYQITFRNGSASDTLSFSVEREQPKPEGEIIGVGLLVDGNEIPMSLDGDQIDLQLDGLPQDVFELVIHYSDGPDRRRSLIFNYEAPQPTPEPSEEPTPQPTPEPQCLEEAEYCDNGLKIWKHDGFWNGVECEYQFDYIGECEGGQPIPSETPFPPTPEPIPGLGCPTPPPSYSQCGAKEFSCIDPEPIDSTHTVWVTPQYDADCNLVYSCQDLEDRGECQ